MRQSFRFTIIVAAFVLAFAGTVDGQVTGAVATPPVPPAIAKWDVVYLHFNLPTDATKANAIVRVSYQTSTSTELEAVDVNITGAELASLRDALVTAVTGEPTAKAGKFTARIKAWLLTNGKLKYGAA